MAGTCKRKLKNKAKAKAEAKAQQAAAGCSTTSKPPFKKGERVLCGKKTKPNFTAAQLEFMRKHCFSCGDEFDDDKQLKSHNKDKHSNKNLNEKCSFCLNMFRETGEYELHYLQMRSYWKSFSD
ncbi:hypothetical protein FCM35_KLT06580 [Carex littledalei]|uniref:C2H2-type domain-containing protein n=1 Tax=Carex littledalei TaxID=544730 RepID=A0A833VLN7_9POAL|nr:hypothetical protein FCM35_KLT06580 [Carex littledalei]